MKTKLGLALIMVAIAAPAFAGTTSVRGYVRKDGTYVAPHMRTTPDNSRANNWSTSPNINPYTGRTGHENPYPIYNAPRQTPRYTAPSYPSYQNYPTYNAPRSSGYDNPYTLKDESGDPD
ncbi:MAG: hypothetical protein IPF97_00710 [Sphingomonadales bacterium]|nr:hypothetical protein [Sphingomonadales bacterium]